ncbi:MAG: hypothetical protein OEY63_03135 [Gemmatimonadota bacterium]|nr:hypothetical protein [Gemmatimonadota bacterium]MDH5805241.1 hypothetical protein [Gemmatimonadota bacterium]
MATDNNIDHWLKREWTWRGPTQDSQAGEIFYKLTIDELPGFLVAGNTPFEVIDNRDRKLRAFLENLQGEGRLAQVAEELPPEPEPDTAPHPAKKRHSTFVATAVPASKMFATGKAEDGEVDVSGWLKQPWTWRGPTKDSQAGETFYKLTIDEIPGFLVAGNTPFEVIDNRERKLRSYLEKLVAEGEKLPTPPVPII